MPIDQKNLPILIILQGGEFFGTTIPLPFLFGTGIGVTRPDTWQLTRPSRGTVTHTAASAFLDDFGAGIPTLVIAGNTGWNKPAGIAGLVALQYLEVIFQEYLARRKRTAEAGLDPDLVHLFYLDALNLQAFLVYPHEFNIDRAKNNPLLFMYRIRFTVLHDLKYELLYGQAPIPFSDPLPLLTRVETTFGGLLAA